MRALYKGLIATGILSLIAIAILVSQTLGGFGATFTTTGGAVISATSLFICSVVGLVITGHSILAPHLMVLVMITGDLLGMALTTDNVRPSPAPNAWRIGEITADGVSVGLGELMFCTAMLVFGIHHLGLGAEPLQTLAFVLIVYGNQAICYINRDRRHWWSSRPSAWLLVASALDILITATLAIRGISMTPLPPGLVAGTLGAAIGFLVIFDLVKSPILGAGRKLAHLGTAVRAHMRA